jgi:hypothetical protein
MNAFSFSFYISMPSISNNNAHCMAQGKEKHNSISGSNPTIESYNASAVKIYNAKRSPVRFEKNKQTFSSPLKKNSGLLHCWRCG